MAFSIVFLRLIVRFWDAGKRVLISCLIGMGVGCHGIMTGLLFFGVTLIFAPLCHTLSTSWAYCSVSTFLLFHLLLRTILLRPSKYSFIIIYAIRSISFHFLQAILIVIKEYSPIREMLSLFTTAVKLSCLTLLFEILIFLRKLHLTSTYSEVHNEGLNQQLCFPISQKLRKKFNTLFSDFFSIITINCCEHFV